MNMRARRDSGDSVAESDERHSHDSQFVKQHPATGTIGMKRDINRIAMIKPEAIVKTGLPEGANRQRAPKLRND